MAVWCVDWHLGSVSCCLLMVWRDSMPLSGREEEKERKERKKDYILETAQRKCIVFRRAANIQTNGHRNNLLSSGDGVHVASLEGTTSITQTSLVEGLHKDFALSSDVYF